MGSRFDARVYWHFFAITVDCNCSHIELVLNDVCLTNLYKEALTVVRISGLVSILSNLVQSSQLLYDWLSIANQFVLATSPFETQDQNFYFPTEYLRI
jgi:hypothetical protein